MRSRRDVQLSNRHNETKAPILFCIAKVGRHGGRGLTSEDIAEACNLTYNNASQQMKKLTHQGYVWRKNIGKKSFLYRFLKPHGDRVCKELWIRIRMKEKTGNDEISLNLKKQTPSKYDLLRKELEMEYNEWLFNHSAE